MKNIRIFIKFFKFSIYLNRRVFVMGALIFLAADMSTKPKLSYH